MYKRQAPVTLASGVTDNTIDFGFSNPSSLGDFVWNDVNANGIQDSGEVGISNVKVNLYNNGTCTGTAQATTNTNASGLYAFNNLTPGTYCVQVDSTNFSGAGVLLGWNSSPKDQGGDDTKDSDGDTVTHNSPSIALAAGAGNPTWLFYTSDGADRRSRGDLGGRLILKKKKNKIDRDAD